MDNNWSDFEKYVFQKLIQIEDRANEISGKISALEVRATLWGGLAGLVPVVLWLAIEHFK